MIESFVDLTYRGLSLGRRIKLTEVRPTSGTLELANPMPVGTHVAVTIEEGVTFDATVSWVYEQIAGSDRTPGMVVVPVLAADPAAAWWQARVAMSDEDRPKQRAPRGRPVTLRPRSNTELAPPPEGAITEEVPTSIAELHARVHAAARVEPSRPPAALPGPGERLTTVMNALEQQELAQLTRKHADESALRSSGEHDVIDDGRKTATMMRVDAPAPERDPVDPVIDPVIDTREDAAADTREDGDEGDDGEAGEAGEAGGASPGDKPAPGRGVKKRRKRR